MFRKIYNDLVEWKNNRKGKTALLVEGARRVGKSYIVEEFARKEYKSYVLVDFKEAGRSVKPIKEALEYSLSNLSDFFTTLEIFSGVKLHERETLIIFDEVQSFPRAREAIKFLVADGRYDYIETGSLISIRENIKDIQIPSEEECLELRPMDFEEFLIAMGKEALYQLIRGRFENKKPLGQELHREATNWFRKYLLVGGMPQSVDEFRRTSDLVAVDKVKRSILRLYTNDLIKHGRKAARIFVEIPSQLSKHEKRFTYASIDSKGYPEVADDFFFLEDAKLVNLAFNATEPNIGLRLTREDNALKCYLADTGLLISLAFDESREIGSELYRMLLHDTLSFNEGMVMENVVCQMLVASGHKAYYFSRSSRTAAEDRMEVDFLIAKKGLTTRHNIVPVEVKSGKNYTHSSLDKIVAKYRDYMAQGIIIHTGDYEEKAGYIHLPIYMVPFL